MSNIVKQGDILPAVEAIAHIPHTDLTSPIEVPPIPEERLAPDEHAFLTSEINRFKKERNALVLSHNYQIPGIQDVADFVGDSLFLMQKGVASDADVLVEASVLFMPQLLAIKKKRHQIVLAPHLGALCSLAAHADPEKIRAWKKAHAGGVVVSYVNTYIDVKAETDYCCASANVDKVILHAARQHPGAPILLLPDVYLGLYAVKLLEKAGESTDRLFLMMGACHVHEAIRPYHIEEMRQKYPDAAVAAHPECGCTSKCMNDIAEGRADEAGMQIRSTQGMVKFMRETPHKTIIMATEVGNIYPMQKAAPEKTIVPASEHAVCAFMKQNTLRNLYESLRDMKYEVTVDPVQAARARIPLDRMLNLT